MTTENQDEPTGFDFRLLGMGVLMLLGAIVLGSVSYFTWTRSGEVYIVLPIAAVVLLMIGGGSIIKAIGGDAIEWD